MVGRLNERDGVYLIGINLYYPQPSQIARERGAVVALWRHYAGALLIRLAPRLALASPAKAYNIVASWLIAIHCTEYSLRTHWRIFPLTAGPGNICLASTHRPPLDARPFVRSLNSRPILVNSSVPWHLSEL